MLELGNIKLGAEAPCNISVDREEIYLQKKVIENAEITRGSFVGGLIGTARNTTVSDIKFQGNVTGMGHIGGIIGYGIDTVTINNSSSNGEIIGTVLLGD